MTQDLPVLARDTIPWGASPRGRKAYRKGQRALRGKALPPMIRAMRRHGYTYAEISEHLGVSRTTVSAHGKGVVKGQTRLLHEAVRILYAKGFTRADIMRLLSVGRGTVATALKETTP